tara:strand:+ start:301 stop:477 length:177 start_codon:yes stop_codon:yes gene_type:complete
MIDVLLSMELNCAQVKDIIARTKANENLIGLIKTEVIEVLKEHSTEYHGLECDWDAND